MEGRVTQYSQLRNEMLVVPIGFSSLSEMSFDSIGLGTGREEATYIIQYVDHSYG